MTPTSDELQDFLDRVLKAYSSLGPHRNFATTNAVAKLISLAKDWLGISPAIKETAQGFLPTLDKFDDAMAAILRSSQQRTRANVYRTHLSFFKDAFSDDVLVPFMKYEGSPSQSSARQLEATFGGLISLEESAYISEAAKCLASRCNRAAIVMLWAAAVARLHAAVGYAGFAAYNSAIAATISKKSHPFNRIQSTNVAGLADLQLRSDFDILVVGIEMWGYDSQTFSELSGCLNVRNNAAHPGSFEPTSLDIRQFADKLKKYVFTSIQVA